MRRNQFLRINVSRSGVGASVGVRGARISAGPRGTYITLSAYGVRYRQRIDGQGRRTRYPMIEEESVDSGIIETANVADLVDTSSEETLNAINSRMTSGSWVVPTFVALTVLACIVVWAGASEAAGIAAGASGALITICARLLISGRKSTSIYYELDGQSKALYGNIEEGCSHLAQASKTWRYISAMPTSDWKRNAGANVLTKRTPMMVSRQRAPYLNTNVEPWIASSKGLVLVFLPDRLYVWDGRQYGAVSYDQLAAVATTVSFREDQQIPADATVIDHTWQYVRKDGGPDLRFNNNRRIAICLYGTVTLRSDQGLYVEMCVSNPERAQEFAHYLSQRAVGHTANTRQATTVQTTAQNIGAKPLTTTESSTALGQFQTMEPSVADTPFSPSVPAQLTVNVVNGSITLQLGYNRSGQETIIHDLRILPAYALEFIGVLDAATQYIETLRQQERLVGISDHNLTDHSMKVVEIGRPIPANKGTVHVALLMTKAGQATIRLRLRGEPQYGGKLGTDDGYLTDDALNVLRSTLRDRLGVQPPQQS